MTVKFLKKGIKVDGQYFAVHYSNGELWSFPAGTITIYARNYKRFPAGAFEAVENDTDIMTDYFENDRVRVLPTDPIYGAVKAAAGF